MKMGPMYRGMGSERHTICSFLSVFPRVYLKYFLPSLFGNLSQVRLTHDLFLQSLPEIFLFSSFVRLPHPFSPPNGRGEVLPLFFAKDEKEDL